MTIPEAANSTWDSRLCKACDAAAGVETFVLKNAIVLVCEECGFHYTDHLDPVVDVDPEVRAGLLTPERREFIATQLQSNLERARNQVELLEKHVGLRGKKVLDVGCGGGLFLSLVRDAGAEVTGIEPDDVRVEFARSTYDLEAKKYPIEHTYWQSRAGTFDAVTFWDVLEHVNFPGDALAAGARLLTPGGFLCLDTPTREAFYHRVGAGTYRISGGRWPTFLNTMYSNVRFGHKQIMASSDIRRLFEAAGLEVVEIRRIHELTFPYSYYLKQLLGADFLVTLAKPLAAAFFKFFRIRNKMIVVGRKA